MVKLGIYTLVGIEKKDKLCTLIQRKMKKHLFLCLLAATFAWLPGRLSAQSDWDRLNARIDSLEHQLERQNERSEKWARAVEKLPSISGYAQLGYQWSQDDRSSFYIKRVRLSLSGSIYRQIADYRVQLELASPKIVDAYVRIAPWRQFGVQVGQYKVPFSIENVDYAPLKLEAIDYPMALQALMGFSEVLPSGTLSATGRDMGVTFYGGLWKRKDFSVINYRVGVFNGAGINCWDNNKSKDISMRLNINPIKELTLSGSYYWGEWGADYLGRKRFAAGIAYDGADFFARSEYIGGKTGALLSDGYYVTAGWRINEYVTPLVRYDVYRENSDDADCQRTNYLVGVDCHVWKHLRLQLNYTLQHYAVSQAGKNDLSMVQVMVTGMF